MDSGANSSDFVAIISLESVKIGLFRAPIFICQTLVRASSGAFGSSEWAMAVNGKVHSQLAICCD